MFIKKTACDKYLMSLTVQELSALRVMSAWYRTVTEALIAKHGENPHRSPSDGDPTKAADFLCTVWEETNEFRNAIAEASNAG